MTDQLENQTNQPAAPLTRVFKIGVNRVVEDEATAQMTNEQVRELLKATYPEVANATIRERTDSESGLHIIEFLPQPGRKG